MTTRIPPNPHSPYANALPNARHLLPVPIFFPPPIPGKLALTGCARMAVVPTETLRDVTDLIEAGRIGELPPGLCVECVTAATGGDPEDPEDDHPAIAPMACRDCGGLSSQGVWCALCRQELHDAWWPTREAATS
ncbi:hypothetical protein GCM10022254_09350 [Actinomadura meridiana]|uniref:Uncharacterized protein n=1 Tax=Actinomadura meridiana TaxID=559626 RepID=A0ABP8BTP3_9ACTN